MKLKIWGHGKKCCRLKNLQKRAAEIFTVPSVILFGLLLRVYVSVASFFKALLLSVGTMDGILSNYLYKHEKFFPYQFLRYGRIAANLAWIVHPLIPICWNIADGLYSLYLYRKAEAIESIPRYMRIFNGSLLAMLTF